MYTSKKYEVRHIHGGTLQGEFDAFVRQLRAEGLGGDHDGRETFLSPQPNGGFVEHLYLHLWDQRADALRFAEALSASTGPIWRVAELEGVPVDERLGPDRLRADFGLPDRPKVIRIKPRLVPDPTGRGDDALRVWVVLDDDTTDIERSWVGVEPIRLAIHAAMDADEVPLWPLVRYRTESEVAERRPIPR